MTAQDEIRLKEWFGQLHALVEGLQAQINDLRDEVVKLQQKPTLSTAVAPKKTTKAEEPTTP